MGNGLQAAPKVRTMCSQVASLVLSTPCLEVYSWIIAVLWKFSSPNPWANTPKTLEQKSLNYSLVVLWFLDMAVAIQPSQAKQRQFKRANNSDDVGKPNSRIADGLAISSKLNRFF